MLNGPCPNYYAFIFSTVLRPLGLLCFLHPRFSSGSRVWLFAAKVPSIRSLQRIFSTLLSASAIFLFFFVSCKNNNKQRRSTYLLLLLFFPRSTIPSLSLLPSL